MEKAKGLPLAGRAAVQLVLIVVGVTLALWADSWVASRMDRTIESQRLESLDENVARTLVQLRAQGEELDRAAAALGRLLGRPGPDGEAASDTPSLEATMIEGLLSVPAFNPHLNVYEDLKNSGELGLLQDPEVREALSAMDASLRHTLESRADLIQYQQLNVDPFLIRHVDLPRLFQGYDAMEGTAALPAGSDGDFRVLLESQELRNLAVFKLDLLYELRRVSTGLEQALVQAKAAVDHRRQALR